MGRLIRSSLLCLVALPVTLAAQTGPYDYVVKFVCGNRTLLAPPSPASIRNSVRPGVYNTAINLYNSARDSTIFRVLLASTDSAPVPGRAFLLLPNHNLMLPPQHALEIDCDDIFRSSERELDIVAVYSAGPAEALATMDVEHIPPSRRPDTPPPVCRLADLTIKAITGPAHLTSSTRTKVTVANIGGAPADSIEVALEDVTNTTPQRKATAWISTLAPAAEAGVALDHPYLVPPASWPSMVAQVDPKDVIKECREDNNRREVGPR
jgi:hypothetical protein